MDKALLTSAGFAINTIANDGFAINVMENDGFAINPMVNHSKQSHIQPQLPDTGVCHGMPWDAGVCRGMPTQTKPKRNVTQTELKRNSNPNQSPSPNQTPSAAVTVMRDETDTVRCVSCFFVYGWCPFVHLRFSLCLIIPVSKLVFMFLSHRIIPSIQSQNVEQLYCLQKIYTIFTYLHRHLFFCLV